MRRRLILSMGAMAALTACGKKGELELPPADTPEVSFPTPSDDQQSGDAAGQAR